MAEEDEIDILGDFSFDSCLAQNKQGIPSCSSREDTVHPQWLADATTPSWYDSRSRDHTGKRYGGQGRVNSGHKNERRRNNMFTTWTQKERDTLDIEMAKYGRNVSKIAQTLKSKTATEIQTLIEAEHGIHLDTQVLGLVKSNIENGDTPIVVQEEVVLDENIINQSKKPFRRKANQSESDTNLVTINPSEIFYDNNAINSIQTSNLENEIELMRRNLKNKTDYKVRFKAMKKNGNHKRKTFDKKEKKSPARQRNSSVSDESTRSPKMEIVLGSGQALMLSEGEQVIKIAKKNDSEPESDIDIDVDSDNSESSQPKQKIPSVEEPPIAVPLKYESQQPRRQKKLNLDGEGGVTIMHTDAGDVLQVGSEPKKERAQKKQQIQLIQCKMYNKDRPPPCELYLYVSTLIKMDIHAHTSRNEIMGLIGGALQSSELTLRAYEPCLAAASGTHCDMDPVSQSLASESLLSKSLSVVGWHHSHPSFPPWPSEVDLRSQSSLQLALERGQLPFVGMISSQNWPTGRTASQYCCIHIETEDGLEVGFQFSVKLVPDLSPGTVPKFLQEVRSLVENLCTDEFSIIMSKDICKQAGITYLEKCKSSIARHLQVAGYQENEPIIELILDGIHDIFR